MVFADQVQGAAEHVIAFVRAHELRGRSPCARVRELLAFISLLLPAWAVLVGIGALIGEPVSGAG